MAYSTVVSYPSEHNLAPFCSKALMATKLIQLEDGTLIEVEVPTDQAQPISGGSADYVNKNFDQVFDQIQPILLKVCRPFANAWKQISQEMEVEQAEVELGFSFEGEGNLYITKVKGGANLIVKLVLKPKNSTK